MFCGAPQAGHSCCIAALGRPPTLAAARSPPDWHSSTGQRSGPRTSVVYPQQQQQPHTDPPKSQAPVGAARPRYATAQATQPRNHTAKDPSAPAKNDARRRHPEACARGAVPAPLRSARYISCRCMRRRDRRSIDTARRLTCPLSLGLMSRPAPARSMNSSRLLVSYTTLALDSPVHRLHATGAGRGLWYRSIVASASQTCALSQQRAQSAAAATGWATIKKTRRADSATGRTYVHVRAAAKIK